MSSENARMPIVDAGRRGNFELLDECLAAGVSVNALDKSGCSALHGAAQGGHMQCLMRLLQEPKLAINLQVCSRSCSLHFYLPHLPETLFFPKVYEISLRFIKACLFQIRDQACKA